MPPHAWGHLQTTDCQMSTFSCPNCGDDVTPTIARARMVTCPSCDSTILIESDAVRLAGEQGVMHEVPMLFDIGDTVICGEKTVTLHGHARFSYGRGFWEEFWGQTPSGDSAWVSVDEGDVVVQKPVPASNYPRSQGEFRPGREITCQNQHFRVVEVDSAECVALRGSFDEELKVGETYSFVNAQASNGLLLSGELWEGGQSWFLGYWFDPFEIKVRRQS